MIYLDTSVALATILSEDRTPPADLWHQQLVSSRLLTYEVWVRLHAQGLGSSHSDQTSAVIGRIAFVELDARVLARAIEPFPLPVRTLDALHLATLAYLRHQGHAVELASYDDRMIDVARRMQIKVHRL